MLQRQCANLALVPKPVETSPEPIRARRLSENMSPNCSPAAERPRVPSLSGANRWSNSSTGARSPSFGCTTSTISPRLSPRVLSPRLSPRIGSSSLGARSAPWRLQLPSPLALPGSPRYGSPRDESPRSTPLATPRRAVGAQPGPPKRNMTRVRPRILLGNDFAARSRELLSAHNVSHVLNCGRTAEHFRGEPDAPVYLSLGLRDDVAMNGCELHEQLLKAVGFIRRFVREGGESSLLVHCREGISRSCGVMIAYLMVAEDLELGAAMEELRALHQKCDPNLGILMALQDWREWHRAAAAAGRAAPPPEGEDAGSVPMSL